MPRILAGRWRQRSSVAARCGNSASPWASGCTESTKMAITGLGEIAEKLRRSTVLLRGGHRGSGSGVIWNGDGLIVTNAHVARSSPACVQLCDGREFEATVTARDLHRDLASLRINASGLPAATPADSAQIRPGELVIAVGNPLGFVGALTTGVVHAVGPIRGFGAQSCVQVGVRLAPGNSGGPLAHPPPRVLRTHHIVL